MGHSINGPTNERHAGQIYHSAPNTLAHVADGYSRQAAVRHHPRTEFGRANWEEDLTVALVCLSAQIHIVIHSFVGCPYSVTAELVCGCVFGLHNLSMYLIFISIHPYGYFMVCDAHTSITNNRVL